MASEELNLETLSADTILSLFNEALSTDLFSTFSDEEITEGVTILSERIKATTDDGEREKLFCVLVKISQIANLEYVIDSLYE